MNFMDEQRTNMKQQEAIQLFEEKKVRTVWSQNEEKWYFSIIDVIEALTNSDRPRKYWSDLKVKFKKKEVNCPIKSDS